MKKFLSVVAAGAAMVSVAAAQNSLSSGAQDSLVSNPTGIVANFDAEAIGPVLTELGVAWQESTDSSGKPVILANAGGSLVFYLQPTACRTNDNKNCIGLLTISFFEGDANSQTVRAFNDRYHFSRTGLNQSGAFISRYDIADYGVPRGNVASSIANFAYLANLFQSELASAGRTVSLEGYANDLAASSLNRMGLTELTGARAHVAGPVEQHQQSFDEATDDILRLITDKTLPRNKIKNLK